LRKVEFEGNVEGLVFSKNGISKTTSIKIAEVFDRNHREILRAIDSKVNSDNIQSVQFCTDHIQEITYLDDRGRFQRQYELDEEGFNFIALSLTGEQADNFKIKYIEAFSKMRKAINNMFRSRIIESVLPQDNRNRQYLYIIKNPLNETIKIGVAQDVYKRLKQLQTGAGIELELIYQSLICSNAFSIEKNVHSHFEEYRTFGEWFKINPEEVIYFLEQQNFILKTKIPQATDMLNLIAA
jgi:Rha family phage regulatory protein